MAVTAVAATAKFRQAGVRVDRVTDQIFFETIGQATDTDGVFHVVNLSTDMADVETMEEAVNLAVDQLNSTAAL